MPLVQYLHLLTTSIDGVLNQGICKDNHCTDRQCYPVVVVWHMFAISKGILYTFTFYATVYVPTIAFIMIEWLTAMYLTFVDVVFPTPTFFNLYCFIQHNCNERERKKGVISSFFFYFLLSSFIIFSNVYSITKTLLMLLIVFSIHNCSEKERKKSHA